jgi:Protein of unknown function (DUF1566)
MGTGRVTIAMPLLVGLAGCAGGLAACNSILGLDPVTLSADEGGAAAGDDGPSGSDAPGVQIGPDGAVIVVPPPDAGPDGTGMAVPPGNDGACDACVAPHLADCSPVCATSLACERTTSSATCEDPNWAEWPMPNSPTDVSNGAPNTESYTDNGDTTITDGVTGLMWQQKVPSGTSTQGQAISYCAGLVLANHNDWRLPTQIELLSIVDYAHNNPSIDPQAFPGTPVYAYWSSSASATTGFGWGVTFGYGNGGTNLTTFPADVRCVR